MDLAWVKGLPGELKPLYVLQREFNAGELVMQVRAEPRTQQRTLSSPERGNNKKLFPSLCWRNEVEQLVLPELRDPNGRGGNH